MAIVDIDRAVEIARDEDVDRLVDAPSRVDASRLRLPEEFKEPLYKKMDLVQLDWVIDCLQPDTDQEASEPWSIIRGLMKHDEKSAMWAVYANALARYYKRRVTQSLRDLECNASL